VREHITHGYAVTVHSAQGVTADTTHAVLSEKASRALSYVAVTRGRDANTVYLCQRGTEDEHQQESTETDHLTIRGSSQHAARLLRAIVANEEHPMTAHDLAATAGDQALPDHVRGAINQREAAIRLRSNDYERWCIAITRDNPSHAAHRRDIGLDRTIGDRLEL